MAVGLAGFGSMAHATLTVGLELPGGGNTVQVSKAGDSVQLNVVATITGTDGKANEGIQSAAGSIVANLGTGSPSAIVGSFASTGGTSTFSAVAPFNSTVQLGKVQTIGNTGGTDIGFKTGGATTDYVAVRAATLQGQDQAGTVTPLASAPDSVSYLLGTVTYTVSQLPTPGTADVLSWIPRPKNASAAVWEEDGATANTFTSTYVSGQSVTVTSPVPEPGTLALGGVAGMGLLLRRRRSL